jgi:hypothetical protein
MPTPDEFREQSRLYTQSIEEETSGDIRRMLARHAYAVARLAEAIEQDQPGRGAGSEADRGIKDQC